MSRTAVTTSSEPSVVPAKPGWFYWFAWWVVQVVMLLAFRLRTHHVGRIPRQGPVLLVANHQSHLDPPIVGLCVRSRPVRFVARASLFRNRCFGPLIRALGAIPLRDKEGDLGAVRAALACLDEGSPIVVFPEGSRTRDGSIGEFKRGAVLLLKRVRCPIVPIGIEGAYDAWPRQRGLPRVWGTRIVAVVGEPIEAEDLLREGAEAALTRLENEVRALHAEARRRRRGSPSME